MENISCKDENEGKVKSRIITCNSKKCVFNKSGNCNCENLRIFEHEYFDMNPYDVATDRSCSSYTTKR